MDHEFTLSPQEAEHLPDLDPDALCYLCGNNADAHARTKCAIHNLVEDIPDPDEAWVCFECGHVFPTTRAIEMEWDCSFPDKKGRKADDITFCPMCLHDW